MRRGKHKILPICAVLTAITLCGALLLPQAGRAEEAQQAAPAAAVSVKAESMPAVKHGAVIEGAPFIQPPAEAPAKVVNLSPLSMFQAADWPVKAVILGLLFASAFSWAVFIAKSLSLAVLRARARAALAVIAAAGSLEQAVKQMADEKGAGAALLRAAAAEFNKSGALVAGAGNAGLKERAEMELAAQVAKAGRAASGSIGLIATIGSVSPFIGLFGTVWGIMNSFIGIAEAQTSNLAVVAPGIAEALLATAIGLFAAIPATVMYNIFIRSVQLYKAQLNDIAAACAQLLSRDLDVAAHARAAAGRSHGV